MRKWFYLLLPLALASLVCSLGRPAAAPATPDLAAMVNATLTAVAAQPKPTGTPTLPPGADNIPPLGKISGHLSYPASAIPALRLVAFDVQTGQASYTDLPAGQSAYAFELPAGTYHVIAYALPGDGFPGGLAGGYTRAVPCGLAVECADHTLINVTVKATETTENVDPADWYAEAGAFPTMPAP
jgi:hypothetical protein